ncbi:MAG TPA: 3-isopropylmalate dehydratase small subunit [Xanthobacteraceae bacterium]|jgi:3-isopropylmalate/(R)-2-methylmalate dehydratase small subunit
MESFISLTSVAAPLPDVDINTDVIFPARFLLLLNRQGLSQHLFHERRKAAIPERFVLDRPPFEKAQILVAGRNFGCGSSREQAVWALADFGIRCVIAPSFGEIFFANCFRNGVLAVDLAEDPHRRVMSAASTEKPMTVDLESQAIRLPDGESVAFRVDPHRRRALLLGLDQIGSILADDIADIDEFERRHRASAPWLHLSPEKFSGVANAAKQGSHE